MDKKYDTYIHNGILFGFKEEYSSTIQMKLEDITLSEISQSQKDKYYMVSLT